MLYKERKGKKKMHADQKGRYKLSIWNGCLCKKSPESSRTNKWIQQVHRIQDKHTKKSTLFLCTSNEFVDTKI